MELRPAAYRRRAGPGGLAAHSGTLGTQPTRPGTVRRTFTLIVSADAVLRVMPAYSSGCQGGAPDHLPRRALSETTLSRLEYGDADLYLGLKQPAAVWSAGVSRHLAHV